jgi:hypothetical protein
MANDRSRISTQINLEQEGFHAGTLRVPLSADRSAYDARSGHAAASGGGYDSLTSRNIRDPE